MLGRFAFGQLQAIADAYDQAISRVIGTQVAIDTPILTSPDRGLTCLGECPTQAFV